MRITVTPQCLAKGSVTIFPGNKTKLKLVTSQYFLHRGSRCGRADSVLDCTPQVPGSKPGWYGTFY